MTHSFGDGLELPYPLRWHPMSGAPRWAIELFLQNLTLECMMSELQDTLNTYAGEIGDAVGTINTEITALEQQLAAGATPDLSSLKAAVDGLGNTANRISAVADGQPDPLAQQPAGYGSGADGPVVDPTAPATVDDAAAPSGPVDPGVQPDTLDTAAQIPE